MKVIAFCLLAVAFAHEKLSMNSVLEAKPMPNRNMSITSVLLLSTLQNQDLKSAAHSIALLYKQEPDNIKGLNDAIELIIKDVIATHDASQKLIELEIDSYGTCAAMPLIDKDANENAANKFQLIDPAQKEQDKASTGKIEYDFGDSTMTSDLEGKSVKLAIDAYKKIFDDAFGRRETDQSNYDSAQEASDKADAAKVAANHQCYCAARKAYDDVTETAKTVNKHSKENLKHFQMIQCVMVEFANEIKEDKAFSKCTSKTYDDKLVTLDYRVNAAKLDDSVKCDAAPDSEPIIEMTPLSEAVG